MSLPSAAGRILEGMGKPTTENTIGAIFIGWGVSAIIYGMFVVQCWVYYQRYPGDKLCYKALVAGIWALETTHQSFIGHYCWYYIVKGYNTGNVLFFERTVWTFSALVLLGGIIGTVIKIYFACRVYQICKSSTTWTGLICIMTLAQLGTATSYAVKSSRIALADLVTLKALGSTSLALGAATDIMIAVVLSFYLNKMRTGYTWSESLINKIIGYSVRSGALTSAFSLAVLILTMPRNCVFIAFYFLVYKMYSNSCLATLNVRRPSIEQEIDSRSSRLGDGQVVKMTSRLRYATHQVHVDSKRQNEDGSDVRVLDIGVSKEIAVMRDEQESYTDFKPESMAPNIIV